MDLNKLSWESLPPLGELYTPRTGHTLVAHKSSLYLFSGTDDLFKQNDLYEFNQETLTWAKVKVSGDLPGPRSGAQSLVYKDCIFIYGGNAKKVSEYYNDLYKLDISTKKWSKVLTKDNPIPRADHTFVNVKESGFLFGGSNIKKDINDLGDLHELNFGMIQLFVANYS